MDGSLDRTASETFIYSKMPPRYSSAGQHCPEVEKWRELAQRGFLERGLVSLLDAVSWGQGGGLNHRALKDGNSLGSFMNTYTFSAFLLSGISRRKGKSSELAIEKWREQRNFLSYFCLFCFFISKSYVW